VLTNHAVAYAPPLAEHVYAAGIFTTIGHAVGVVLLAVLIIGIVIGFIAGFFVGRLFGRR
jgi:membrane protein DedA with SNARE-associated domain